VKSIEDIRRVLVIGTGMMGPGIALSLARGGFSVDLYGRSAASLERGEANLASNCGRLVEYELAERPQIDAARDRIEVTGDLEGAARKADMVIESVVEDLQIKRDVFASLCSMCSDDTILASNTSGISITKIAVAVRLPARFVGTHFWNPPYLMPLVEVIKGQETSQETFEVACQVIEQAGKQAIRVLKDVPGFLGNRLQHALWREALALVEQGVASPEDVDTMIKYSFAMRIPPLGVFENIDMVGADLVHSIHEYLFAELDRRATASPITARLCEKGELGMKTGQGFFTWTPERIEERKRKRDDEVVRQLRQMNETVL
jgi:3-hydroxybutyryl-CoA dehydrogenase